MESPEQRLNQILEDFTTLGHWTEQLNYLVDLGSEAPSIPASERLDQDLVKACSSLLWFHARYVPGETEPWLSITSYSPSAIPRGIAGMVRYLFYGSSQGLISTFFKTHGIDDLGLLLGLKTNLSPTRYAGFCTMVERVQRAGSYQA